MRTPPVWPGFRDGGLTIPLPATWFKPSAITLDLDGVLLRIKDEFHVTLLDQADGSQILDVLDEAQVRTLFENDDWEISHTGNGVLIRKEKTDTGAALVCHSLIELVKLPAMQRFRAKLANAAGIALPEAPPHVTLYTAGDPKGIGLPHEQALINGTVDAFRLPALGNRTAPRLSEEQTNNYLAAHYAIDSLATHVRIGAECHIVDDELQRRGAARATIVTAYNPFSVQGNITGNELRQQWLLGLLEAMGLQFEVAEGQDPTGKWSPEPSLLVFGTAPQLDERLLRDFEQHAIVVLERGAAAQLILHPSHTPACRSLLSPALFQSRKSN